MCGNLNKMADILRTTFSNVFRGEKTKQNKKKTHKKHILEFDSNFTEDKRTPHIGSDKGLVLNRRRIPFPETMLWPVH